MSEKKPGTARKRTVAKTKQGVLEAYAEALPLAEERRAAEQKPEERIAEKAAQRVAEVADALSTEGVLRGLGSLRVEIGAILTGLGERLEQEVGTYRAVKEAIAAREAELQEIYEIQRAASSLAALLEAQHRRREEFEAELAERQAALEQEIAAARARWEVEEQQREQAGRERDEAEAKRRQREDEEYRYALGREQQLLRDRFEAEKARLAEEKARLEREIGLQREQAGRELAEREQAVRQAEDELAQLRARAAAFPQELESAVAREVKLAVDRARAEAKSREDLLRKEFEGERNVFQTQVASLERTVKEQAEQLAKLSLQVEKSYSQIQDIAVKAIEGSAKARSAAVPWPAETPSRGGAGEK